MTVSLFRGSRAHARGLLGLDAGNRATHVLDPRSLFQLAGRGLEAQVECLALQFAELLGELVVGLLAHVFGLGHGPQPSRCEVSPRRATTFVLIGSFIAARSNASAATGPGTPSSSNRLRPGLTRDAQTSGEPFAFPPRPHAAFAVTGAP